MERNRSLSFVEFLQEQKGFPEAKARTRAANCELIAKSEGSIAEHYAKDGGKELLQRLTFTLDEQADNLPKHHSIHIEGNPYFGTRILKQAASCYLDYLKYLENNF